MTRRMFSVPARWPAARGSPRCVAQRPLPSMMMATCRGTRPPEMGEMRSPRNSAAGSGCATSDFALSDFKEFRFLLLRFSVDGCDVAVRHLLQLLFAAFQVVLGYVSI